MSVWYAIWTAPQREAAVEAALRVKGYDVFMPLEGIPRRSKRGNGPRTVIWRPMFSRYLFVRAPIPWMHIKAERHVAGIVGFGGFDGEPAPINDEAIDRIRSMSGFLRPDVSVNKSRKVRTGDMARISSGAFSGQVVKVTGLHGAKARIFLNLFGGKREADVDLDQLEVA